jgi:hypothetical protein
MLNVGMIVGGTFRLLRDRIGSALVWGLVYSLLGLALGYFMLSTMAPMQALGPRPDPNQAFAAAGSMFGKLILVELAFFCVFAVLLTAAQRAVLRPQDSAFASLRFGADELRIIGLGFFLGILFFVGYLVASLILGILFIAVGVGTGSPNAMIPFAIVGGLVVICLALFFWIKVSLAFPLTLMRRRFVLAEAWTLSRGHFWTLLGSYLLLSLIMLAFVVLASLAMNGTYWSQVIGGGMSSPGAREAARAQMEGQYALGLPLVLNVVVGTIIGGVSIAFTGGSAAIAARALASDQQGMADTFA